MKVKITPSQANGTVKIPSSKSMAHRAIICASLASGKSVLTNVAYSDDIYATIDGMRQLGAQIDCHEDCVIIEGIQDFKHLKTHEIFCNESGSTLRFFIPIFSLCDTTIAFTGKNRLLKRPQQVYADLFAKMNIPYRHTEDKIEIQGRIKGGDITIQGDISSQFISGLLFALPLVEEDSKLHILEPYESRSYVDLTLEMLHRYGIQADYEDANTLVIPGGQHYQAKDYVIEGDYSQLAFFAILGSINHEITCTGLSKQSLQGDQKILAILQKAGAQIEETKEGFIFHPSSLHGSEIDLQDCPDLGPILNIMGMYAEGQTRIYNAARLRYKESDRIEAMETELKKCNVDIQTTENEILLTGKRHYQANDSLSGHKDHRIVMSLCIAATCFDTPTVIEGAEAINKSYPAFFDDLRQLGIDVEVLHD